MSLAQQVAAAIIVKDRHVLVTRRAPDQKLAGFWEFPGGKLEQGETVQSCIERELAEELGVAVVAGRIVASNLHAYSGGTIELIGVLTAISNEDWTLTVHDEARWVSSDELLSLNLAPADIPIAKTVCELFANATSSTE